MQWPSPNPNTDQGNRDRARSLTTRFPHSHLALNMMTIHPSTVQVLIAAILLVSLVDFFDRRPCEVFYNRDGGQAASTCD